MSALVEAPGNGSIEHEGVVSDHKLVAQVRRGDDRAFEGLYERYQRRIHAYVYGMVKDHQRAEDVTQEVFVSALRRMRATERPIAFKPWVYEIAKNACIDQFRRSKRAEEISFDADEGLAPSDYGRLVSREPVPDVAVAAKQQLDHVVGAFGGLSEAHHQILVLRELEGLSYREIGERMGMSRPAVESTLFRARRRLSEEYDELASGQRCMRIQSIITTATSGRLGARDTRRLARHVAHCQACRRQALAAGVDAALVARKPVTRRAVEKVAALFPFPLLLRFRRGDSGEGWSTQLPLLSDHAAAGGAKLAAVAALVVAGLGAGVGTQVAGREDRPAADRPARASERTSSATPASATERVSSTVAATRAASDDVSRAGRARAGVGALERLAGTRSGLTGAGERRQASAPAAGGSGSADGSGTGSAVPQPVRDATPQTPGGASTPSTPSTGTPDAGVKLPSEELPVVTIPQDTTSPTPAPVVDTQPVTGAVEDVTGAVQETTSGATQPVEDATGIPLP
jgi:RNA polymerase sigma factor (sigma-70 family)